MRFEQFDEGVSSAILAKGISSLRKSEYFSRPYVRELVEVDAEIRRSLRYITRDNAKLVMVRKIGNVLSFVLVYELQSIAYRVEAIRTPSSAIHIID